MAIAARICAVYLTIGSLWILFSDRLLEIFTGSEANLSTTAQTLKGWGFVLVTGAALYLILRREFNRRAKLFEIAHDREKEFHLLFAANPIPMWVFDRETLAFLDVNDAACLYYGYSRDEFRSMRITDIRPETEVPRLLEDLEQVDEGYRTAGEWKHRAKDGRMIDVSISAHRLNFADREAVLIAVQDITERKRSETERLETENLRLMLAKESELRAMRNRFISMVSHEFRRPLTTITTSIELLEHYRSKMTEDAAEKHFARIHDQLDEAKDLLDDFLALMQAEAVEQGFKPAELELTELCAKLIDAAKNSPTGDHELCYDIACASIRLHADEKLLRYAIGNLLSNALKYSPPKSEVRLYLGRDQAEHIKISVTDHGMGIPAAEQAKIFSPFFRASNARDINGTGLGLSIAKQAVELHGGTLEVVKSDPSGTEFVILLPEDDETLLTGC